LAIFTAGGIVGQVSGRVAGNVFSHNKGGPYIRNGTIPTTSTTPDAMAAKGRLTAASQAWQALTADQKLGWKTFAQNNPTVNRLGHTIHLTGHQWFVRCATRLLQIPIAMPTTAPADTGPVGLTTLTLSADLGAGTFDYTYTATPLAATEQARCFAFVADSAGVNFVKNQLRFIGVSAAAQASPFDCEAQLIAKFGTPTVGHYVHIAVDVIDNVSGLVSSPMVDSAIVEDTV